MSCATASVAAGAELPGTATRASRWLLVEHAGRWERDAAAGAGLHPSVADALARFDGRVLLMRRPRTSPAAETVFHAETTEGGGVLRRLGLGGLALPDATPPEDAGEVVAGPLVLVCVHGRRDPCCARLGPPTYDALGTHLDPQLLWQSSHHGGHRFAANVLVLPWGAQLGRVGPGEAAAVAAALRDGRIPLEHYRGRTLYDAPVQAAEVAVRRARALDRPGAVRLLDVDGRRVRFDTDAGELRADVEEHPGPVVPASCGDDPAPTTRFEVRVESA